MGEPGYPDRRRTFADSDRQPFQGHASAVAARAEGARGCRLKARPARHQGPGERQARAGDRGRGWASPPDDRRARRRQIDAGGAPALDPAAAVAERIARGLDDRLRRRRDRGWRADIAATVPLAASFRKHGRAHRRRRARKARRDLAGASGRAVPRRAARVRSARAGFAAPAAGERRGLGLPRQPSRHLPCPLHADRGDESLPLRQRVRARLFLQARPHRSLHRRLPGAHLRPADGPHRSAHRGAGRDRGRSDPAAAGRRLR